MSKIPDNQGPVNLEAQKEQRSRLAEETHAVSGRLSPVHGDHTPPSLQGRISPSSEQQDVSGTTKAAHGILLPADSERYHHDLQTRFPETVKLTSDVSSWARSGVPVEQLNKQIDSMQQKIDQECAHIKGDGVLEQLDMLEAHVAHLNRAFKAIPKETLYPEVPKRPDGRPLVNETVRQALEQQGAVHQISTAPIEQRRVVVEQEAQQNRERQEIVEKLKTLSTLDLQTKIADMQVLAHRMEGIAHLDVPDETYYQNISLQAKDVEAMTPELCQQFDAASTQIARCLGRSLPASSIWVRYQKARALLQQAATGMEFHTFNDQMKQLAAWLQGVTVIGEDIQQELRTSYAALAAPVLNVNVTQVTDTELTELSVVNQTIAQALQMDPIKIPLRAEIEMDTSSDEEIASNLHAQELQEHQPHLIPAGEVNLDQVYECMQICDVDMEVALLMVQDGWGA